ncbi:MarR family winged helix-turn-helix transcriptional regulator [Lacticaseibacillus baoqingensis]|uniref:MarR family winged helix-turn-helix transcriptional regulator n=1 Tax=Lacticaseibacillus baoqingensis TaxID=2486013 RepID=A0ABW4EA00_9LACO|nr:MarR family transcriptional regulator [Lacticaseibacillus baoqingensis]
MDLGSENELVEHIFHITRSEQHFVQQQLKKVGLNVLQAQALNYIAQHPAAIQKAVSQYLGKQEATTTNLLKALEARQLILRRKTVANERQKQLYLTPEGQESVQTVRAVFIDLEQRVSAPLSAAEKTQLITLLKRISVQADFSI